MLLFNDLWMNAYVKSGTSLKDHCRRPNKVTGCNKAGPCIRRPGNVTVSALCFSDLWMWAHTNDLYTAECAFQGDRFFSTRFYVIVARKLKMT